MKGSGGIFRRYIGLLIITLSLVILQGCSDTSQAREELGKRGFTISTESFINSIEYNQPDVAFLFLRAGMDPNTIITETKEPVIILASKNGNVKIVKLLIDFGADINNRDTDGGTALIHAASNGNIEVEKVLLEAGADINAEDFNFGNALTAALVKGYINDVKLLISQGANVNYLNNLGQTPLMMASYFGYAEIVKTLIENGADINIACRDKGWTPLMYAIEQSHYEVVKILVENGAKQDIHSWVGETALDMAKKIDNKLILQILNKVEDQSDF